MSILDGLKKRFKKDWAKTLSHEEDPTAACKACRIQTQEDLIQRTRDVGCEGVMNDLLCYLEDETAITYLLSTPRGVVINIVVFLLKERSALGLSLSGKTRGDLRKLGGRKHGRVKNKTVKRAIQALQAECQRKFHGMTPSYVGVAKEFITQVTASQPVK